MGGRGRLCLGRTDLGGSEEGGDARFWERRDEGYREV